MTLSGVTTPVQSGPGRDCYEEVVRITQSSNITATSPSDCLVLYQETRWGSYPSAEVKSVYSTSPAD